MIYISVKDMYIYIYGPGPLSIWARAMIIIIAGITRFAKGSQGSQGSQGKLLQKNDFSNTNCL